MPGKAMILSPDGAAIEPARPAWSIRVRWSLCLPFLVGLAALLLLSYRMLQSQLDGFSGVLGVVVASAGLWCVVELIASGTRCSAASRGKMRMVVTTILLLLIVWESFLRLTGLFSTYLERNERQGYKLFRNHTHVHTWFHAYTPNIDFAHPRPEFSFPRRTNSLGLCEVEFPTSKAPEEFRMIALGDSFTEGVGTAYDATWVKVMEKALQEQFPGQPITAFNAGVSGSDVWAEYVLLREKLLPYRPDLVIVAFNVTDMQDIMVRGGGERFQTDGTVRPRQVGPSWERLYGISYVTRWFAHVVLGYNTMFLKKSQVAQAERQALVDIRAALEAFGTLARQHQFRLLAFVHPMRDEVSRGQYNAPFGDFVADLQQTPDLDIFNVLTYWQDKQIVTPQNTRSFYWPLDGHNNPPGYAAIGQAVAERVKQMQVIQPQ